MIIPFGKRQELLVLLGLSCITSQNFRMQTLYESRPLLYTGYNLKKNGELRSQDASPHCSRLCCRGWKPTYRCAKTLAVCQNRCNGPERKQSEVIAASLLNLGGRH